MHTTMDDIARECGLSKKTVSRVFTDSDTVKASTREKVLETAKRLRYEVNLLARNLTTNKSGYIGIAAPLEALLGGSYFADVIKGFNRSISDGSEYFFALFDTNSNSFNNGEKLAKLYRQRRVDGLLVVAMHTHDQFVDSLDQIGVPLVVVGEKPSNPKICSTICNDAKGINLLCSHLYDLGHRRIAFMEGPGHYASSILRKQTFMNFAEKKGLNHASIHAHLGYTTQALRAAATMMMQSSPRPTAILASNDTLASGLIEGIHLQGLRVPEDVSVVGFDDGPLAEHCVPGLTTVYQPVTEMAELSARKLLHALDNGILPERAVTLDPHLVVRASTAKPA